MGDQDRPVAINASRIPVAGVGGLGLVAMAVVVSVFLPAAGGVMVSGLVGGGILAAALIFARRRGINRKPDGRAPSLLLLDSSRPCPIGERSEPSARQRAKRGSFIPARQGA